MTNENPLVTVLISSIGLNSIGVAQHFTQALLTLEPKVWVSLGNVLGPLLT